MYTSTVYIEICGKFIFLRVHALTAKLRKVCSAILTPVPHTSQPCRHAYTWKPLTILSAVHVCASMMIGHATAVYYVHTSCKFMMCNNAKFRRFAKLKPCKNFVLPFFSQSRNIVPTKMSTYMYTVYKEEEGRGGGGSFN